MFGISLARISLLTGTSLGGGVGVSPTLDLNFRGQGYSAAMAGYTFNQLIDFTRTSSATYVDATGKIVPTPASRNLLTFTQEFDNAAWIKNSATVTANSTTAPDGTLTADNFVCTAGLALHETYQNVTLVSGTPYVVSVYAKKNTQDFIQLRHYTTAGSSTRFANFDLQNGTVGTVGADASATITSVGNGWYRCSLLASPTANSSGFNLLCVPASTSGSAATFNAAGTETVYLWGAQLEANTTATDYTRNFGGVFPPRFDYDPVTLAPRGLLIEEQRTNLLLRSEEFDNVYWSKTYTTVTANATTAPDGTLTGDTFTATATANSNVYRPNVATLTNGQTYTASRYVKAGSKAFCTLGLHALADAYFDLNSLTYSFSGTGAVSASIIDVGNGWRRISATWTWGAGTTYGIYLGMASSLTSQSGLTVGDYMYVWGAQLEAGSFATSYIPTVASQVTRTADVAAITGANFSQWYNQSEGTFVVQGTRFATGMVTNVLGVSDGTTTNRMRLYQETNYRMTFHTSVLGSTTTGNGSATYNTAAAYSSGGVAVSCNGGTVAVSAAGAVPTGLVSMNIGGNSPSTTSNLNGHIRSIRYYPTRLTNTQLQALTA